MKPATLHALFFTATLLLCPIARSAEPAAKPEAPTPKEKSKSYFFSSLLPTAFQAHPLLAISVITEKTADGKKLPDPTAAKPTYYIARSAGYHHEGHGAKQDREVSETNIQQFVQTALAKSHHLPADKEHPATLALFYFWGVHSKFDSSDADGEGGFRDVGNRNFLSRAQLVGGTKFANEFAAAIRDRERSTLPGAGGPIGIDPVYMFSVRTTVNRSLVEQVIDDCYYVVVSAYDAGALAKGERKLLWRTKMSTPAQGVSLAETTPALVASGGPYFGRDMNEPSIVDKRIHRKGTVDSGELKVIEMGEPSAATPPANAPATGKK